MVLPRGGGRLPPPRTSLFCARPHLSGAHHPPLYLSAGRPVRHTLHVATRSGWQTPNWGIPCWDVRATRRQPLEATVQLPPFKPVYLVPLLLGVVLVVVGSLLFPDLFRI